jgi:GH18 family chitinase
MVVDYVLIKRFSDSAVEFLIKHKFDGLDIDWMMSAHDDDENAVQPYDKYGFVQLLRVYVIKFSPKAHQLYSLNLLRF